MIVPFLVGCVAILATVAFLSGWLKRESPGLPPKASGALPFVGNIESVRNPVSFFTNARSKYGDIYRITLVGREWFIVSGREHFSQYFKASDKQLSLEPLMDHLQMRKMMYEDTGKVGKDLEVANGFALKRILVSHMDNEIMQIVEREINNLPTEGSINLASLARRTTGLVICSLWFGIHNLPEKLFTEMTQYTKLIDTAVKTGMMWPLLSTWTVMPKVLRARENLKKQLIPYIIAARSDPKKATAYLTFVFETEFEIGAEKRLVTNEEVALFILIIFFASSENTAIALANFLLIISEHPKEIAELREEVKNLSAKQVGTNKSLQAWLDETARVSKGFTGSARATKEDLEIANYVIPKGSWMMIDCFSEGIELGELLDRKSFNPARWLESSKPDKNLIWGAGTHACPGRFFAQAVMKLVAHQVITRLSIEPSGESYVRAPTMGGSETFSSFPCSYQVKYHKI